MPAYTLKYFAFRGRGELARLLFAASETEFTNEVVEFKDWSNLKPSKFLSISDHISNQRSCNARL